MKATLFLLAATCASAIGQGSLTPPGSPAPVMKSLQDIWDKSTTLESQVLAEVQQLGVLHQSDFQQSSLLGVVLEASGAVLPWRITTVVAISNPVFDSSLAFSPSGLPAISYYDGAAQDLKLAAFDGSTWQLSTVESDGDAGYHSSLAFSADGRPAVSYTFFDGANVTLRYAVRNGATWQ
ncbi:hypothetical protein HQ447_19515, partial [bacterium]|nr:hypothetical protein [bacterium]